MKLSDLGKGYAALNAGAWVGDIPLPLFAGVRLNVRRLWNPDFTALYETLTGTDDEKLNECLVKTCLVGWDGVDDAFSPETAASVIADPEAGPIFKAAILWSASKLADQVKASIEADEKN